MMTPSFSMMKMSDGTGSPGQVKRVDSGARRGDVSSRKIDSTKGGGKTKGECHHPAFASERHIPPSRGKMLSPVHPTSNVGLAIAMNRTPKF
jgi:hypothetical protein